MKILVTKDVPLNIADALKIRSILSAMGYEEIDYEHIPPPTDLIKFKYVEICRTIQNAASHVNVITYTDPTLFEDKQSRNYHDTHIMLMARLNAQKQHGSCDPSERMRSRANRGTL